MTSTSLDYLYGIQSNTPSGSGFVTFHTSFSKIPFVFTNPILPSSVPFLFFLNIFNITNQSFQFSFLQKTESSQIILIDDEGHLDAFFENSTIFHVSDPSLSFCWIALLDPSLSSIQLGYERRFISELEMTIFFSKQLSTNNPIIITQPISTTNDPIGYLITISSFNNTSFNYGSKSMSGTDIMIQTNFELSFYWMAIDPSSFSNVQGNMFPIQYNQGTQLFSLSINPSLLTQIIHSTSITDDCIQCQHYNLNSFSFQWKVLTYRNVLSMDHKNYVQINNVYKLESSPKKAWLILSGTEKAAYPLSDVTLSFFHEYFVYESGINTDSLSTGFVSFTTSFQIPPTVFTQMISSTSNHLYYVNVYAVTIHGFYYIKLYNSIPHYPTKYVSLTDYEPFYWVAFTNSTEAPIFCLQMGVCTIESISSLQETIHFQVPLSTTTPLILTQPFSNCMDTIYSIQIIEYNQHKFSYFINSMTSNQEIQTNAACNFFWIAIDPRYVPFIVGDINADHKSQGAQTTKNSIIDSVIVTQMIATNKKNIYKCNICDVQKDAFHWNKYSMSFTSSELDEHSFQFDIHLDLAKSEPFFWISLKKTPSNSSERV